MQETVEPARDGSGRLRYPSLAVTLSVVLAVVVRPTLWATAFVQVFRLARRRWWMTPPFLPVPTREYLAFRAVTQYGGDPVSAVASIGANDVVNYLRWCRQWNRSGL